MNAKRILTEKESLQLIGRMLYEAKGYHHESGRSALIYGFSMAACSLLSYARAVDAIAFPFWPFYLMIPVFFVQHRVQWLEARQKKAKTVTDEAVEFVWLSFFAAVLAACCGGFAGLQYQVVSIVLFLLAAAALVTGLLTGFRYHVVAAGACGLLAIASFFFQNPIAYLLLAAAAILVWIVPGFILRSAFRKQHA